MTVVSGLMPSTEPLRDIRSLQADEITSALKDFGHPQYRGGQILNWLYPQRVRSFQEMTNLSRELREQLSKHYGLYTFESVTKTGSNDTTQKFLWKLKDGALIESVLIPANPALYGDAADRKTLCVSTQVGCAYGCKFCASGLEGWKRNLTVDEIVGQVIAVEQWHKALKDKTSQDQNVINNLVIMGMGEPLANYDNLLPALRILNAPWGGSIGARKITVSTSGLVPKIRQLADEPEQFGLAISLHGATNAIRDQIMPVNKRYPVEALMEACHYYSVKKKRLLTFEYILIDKINDSVEHTIPLAKLAHQVHAKVNLIPYNKVDGLPWERPDETTQERFLNGLIKRGVTATLRREKGHDIDAACGQLRLKVEGATQGC